jgi:hypothetical protein
MVDELIIHSKKFPNVIHHKFAVDRLLIGDDKPVDQIVMTNLSPAKLSSDH